MSTVKNPQTSTQSESKSARKKKAKAEAASQQPGVAPESEATAGQTAVESATNGADGAYESPYLKELYK